MCRQITFKKTVLIGTIVFSTLSFASLSSGDSYFVAPGGSDSDAGSLYRPWCSVRKGVQSIHAGDTLYLRSGTYSGSANINLLNNDEGESGTAEQPIVLCNYPGEIPVLDAAFTAPDGETCTPVFNIEGKHYWILDGLTIKHGRVANIRLSDEAAATNITIRNCDIFDFIAATNCAHIYIDGDAVGGLSDNIEIINNRLHGMISYNMRASGILLFYAGSVKIANNDLYGTSIGIYYKQSWHDGKKTIIENNIIRDQTLNGIRHTRSDAIIRNNLFKNIKRPANDPGANPGTALFFYDGEAAWGCERFLTRNNQILHNTIVDCEQGIYLNRSNGVSECEGAMYTIVRDNLICGFTSKEAMGMGVWLYCDRDTSTTVFDHNLVSSVLFPDPVRILNKNYAVSATPLSGGDNVSSHPVFLDSAHGNFILSKESPGRNSASDKTDIGADISKIGVSATSAIRYVHRELSNNKRKALSGLFSPSGSNANINFFDLSGKRMDIHIPGFHQNSENLTGALRRSDPVRSASGLLLIRLSDPKTHPPVLHNIVF